MGYNGYQLIGIVDLDYNSSTTLISTSASFDTAMTRRLHTRSLATTKMELNTQSPVARHIFTKKLTQHTMCTQRNLRTSKNSEGCKQNT